MKQQAAWRLGWILIMLCAGVGDTRGHAFAPSLLELRELQGGVLEVKLKQPKVRRSGSELRPVLPDVCRATTPAEVISEGTGWVATWRMQCPAGHGSALVGQTVAMSGIAESQADVLLRLTLADGRSFHHLLTADQPSFVVSEKAGPWKVAQTYTVIGVEHILLGWDHLLFVLGLVLLVTGGRRLLWTVTAFTAGHSVTLGLAALGLVNLPTRPIEVLIALSLFILAAELTRARTEKGSQPSSGSWWSRYPWRMAAAFGLLHGLGFAAALSEVGLPPNEVPAALLAFNLGIEAGQLAFIAALLSLSRISRWAISKIEPRVFPTIWTPAKTWVSSRLWAMAGAYGIGCLSAFWVFERILG